MGTLASNALNYSQMLVNGASLDETIAYEGDEG